MKPGQRIQRWWQEYVVGRLTTPQSIIAAARAENPDAYEDRFTQEPVDNVEWDTPERLAKPGFLLTASYAQQQLKADWQHCDPRMQLLAARCVLIAGKAGIPLYVHSAFRSKEQQDELVRRKVSKAPFPRSSHNIGEAFDLVHGVYHWNLTAREWSYIHWLCQDQLRKINAKLPKSQKLLVNWGGNDGTPSDTFKWDPAHWEILDYRSRIRALRTGTPVHMSPTTIIDRIR
jgi:hypothetical protein